MSGVLKLREAMPKRHRSLDGPSEQPLPVVIESLSGIRASHEVWPCYRGVFTGHSVIVSHLGDAQALHNMGCFGKPSTSKFSKSAPTILRRRQYLRRQSWADKTTPLVTTATVRPEESSDSSSDESVVVEQERPQKRASWPEQGLATRNWYHATAAWGNTDMTNNKEEEEEIELPPSKKVKLQTVPEISNKSKLSQSLSDDEIMILSDSRPSSPEILLLPQGKENKSPNLTINEKPVDDEDNFVNKITQNTNKDPDYKTVKISDMALSDSCEEIDTETSEKLQEPDITEIIEQPLGTECGVENSHVEKNVNKEEQNSVTPEIINLDQPMNSSTTKSKISEKESQASTTKDPEIINLDRQEISVEHLNSKKRENNIESQSHGIINFDDSSKNLSLEKLRQDLENLRQGMNTPEDCNIIIDITSPVKNQTLQNIFDISSPELTIIEPTKVVEQDKPEVLVSDAKDSEKANGSKDIKEKEQISIDPEKLTCEQETNDIQKTVEGILNTIAISENNNEKSTSNILKPSIEESSNENKNHEKSMLKESDIEMNSEKDDGECTSTSSTFDVNALNARETVPSFFSLDDKESKDTDTASVASDSEDGDIHLHFSMSDDDVTVFDSTKDTSEMLKNKSELAEIAVENDKTAVLETEVLADKIKLQIDDFSSGIVELNSNDNLQEKENVAAQVNCESLNKDNDVQLTVESILVEVEAQSFKQDISNEKMETQKNSGNLEKEMEADITKNCMDKKIEETRIKVVDMESLKEIESNKKQTKETDAGPKQSELTGLSQDKKESSDSACLEFSDSDICNLPITESRDYEAPEVATDRDQDVAADMLEFLPITESGDYEGLNYEVGVVVISDCEVEGDKEEIISKWRPQLAPNTYRLCDESLNLSLEESFFLSWALGCLNVSAPQSLLLGLLPFETIPPEKPPSEPKPKKCDGVKPHLNTSANVHDVIMIEDGESSATQEGRSVASDVMVIEDKTEETASGGVERLQEGRTAGKDKGRAESPQPGPSGLQNFPTIVSSTAGKTESREVPLSPPLLWSLCLRSQPGFACRYAVYHHYRSLGWVVKSGLKFGGDFLLYRQGPRYHHASYVVIVCRAGSVMAWQTIMTANRVAEVTNKEVLLCWVHWPHNDTEDSLECLSSATLSQRLVARPKFNQSHREEEMASGEESDYEDSD